MKWMPFSFLKIYHGLSVGPFLVAWTCCSKINQLCWTQFFFGTCHTVKCLLTLCKYTLSYLYWCSVLSLKWPSSVAAAESQCRCARICMCQHITGGATEPGHPRLPPAGRGEAPGAHVARPQPGCQGDCCWGPEVSLSAVYHTVYCPMCHVKYEDCRIREVD